MIEQTKETQRSICASYAKDIVCAMIENDGYKFDDGKNVPSEFTPEIREQFSEMADHIHKWVTRQKITTNQKTKIFALMDLKKIASKEDLTIRKHLDDYTLEDAGYLIEKLATEVYGSELPPDMQDYLNTQKSVMEAVKSRVQRDESAYEKQQREIREYKHSVADIEHGDQKLK